VRRRRVGVRPEERRGQGSRAVEELEDDEDGEQGQHEEERAEGDAVGRRGRHGRRRGEEVSGAEVAAWWSGGLGGKWRRMKSKNQPSVRPQRKESGADCGVKFQIQVNFVGRDRYPIPLRSGWTVYIEVI